VTELLVLLVFPVILSLSAAYPVYAMVLYFLVRRGGDPDQDARREKKAEGIFAWIVGALSLCGYVIGVLWFMDINVFSQLYRFVERGGLGLIVPVIVVDVILACVLNPNRNPDGQAPPSDTA